MKKNILLILFVFVTSIVNSQVITVKMDTTQFFEHSALLSTPEAIKLNKLNYTDLYEHKNSFDVTFDLNNMTESFLGKTFKITKINKSNNIIDVIVDEDGTDTLVVLGETYEGGLMYIIEYRDGDLIKGFFSKNPKIIYE